MKTRYDCVVIGGGPGGSTAAALVAEAGWSTLLVERDQMPRFHVGESLMPETYWTLQRLGVLERMQHSDFVPKLSVQFVTHTGKESQPFFFRDRDPRECSQTWQVERAEFDKLLFENAAAKGADCCDQTRVQSVLFDGSRATGVRIVPRGAEPVEVAATVVVDATGQQALLANALRLRQDDPRLRNAAIWGYYRHARRDPGENGGATIILHTQGKRSWFWFIPLSNEITSIGVVGANDHLLRGRGKPADVYREELVKCPALGERLTDAEFLGEFHVAKEFSYTTRQQSGDGWVLVGDAFGFIDPIYSSGVYLALRSGELAADAVVEGLRQGDTSAGQLGRWIPEFSQGAAWIRKLVDAYYTPEFSFAHFLKEHPNYRGDLTDLLVGRVFHEGAGRIFDDMTPALERSRRMAEDRSAGAAGS